jgi:1-acyl-sn-glycerol-3-phosphate acyltransferase
VIAGALAALARIISGASVQWQQSIAGNRQRIWFANHSSHLDFVLIWSALPPALRATTRPIAGSDYWGRGPIRRFVASTVFRAILVERSSGPPTPERAGVAIEHIAAQMGSESSIIVFPEGTRSLSGELLPFKSGLYHLCKLKPDVELVPVYLANLSRILPKGELLPVPLSGRVRFGDPMQLRDGETKDAFLARAREALLTLRNS